MPITHTLKYAHPLTLFKMYQRQRAETIRKAKGFRKCMPGGMVPTLKRWQVEYRHNHVAYCELRGRKYEEIESKVRPENKLDRSRVNKIKGWWKAAIDRHEEIRQVVQEATPGPVAQVG